MPLSISLLSRADLEAALALLEAQLTEHDLPASTPALRRVLETVQTDPRNGFIFLAQEADTPVGLAFVAAHLSAEHGGVIGWLEELYVRPDCRGRGVGSALLAAVAARAAELDWRALELEVMTGHEQAIPLYQRHGFEQARRSRLTRRLGGDAP